MKLYELTARLKAILAESQNDNADFEAKQLAKFALGMDDNAYLLNLSNSIANDNCKRLIALAEKRASGYPLQYILGEWDFFGLTFKVREGALIPRVETEMLCELAAEHGGKVVADLFSGTGCVGISLAVKAKCEVTSIELDEKAFAVLQENAERFKAAATVKTINADVLDLDLIKSLPQFDVILANPPYIDFSEKDSLQVELKYEPDRALFAENHGLYFYEKAIPLWAEKLDNGGLMAFEVGIGQAELVSKIFAKIGLTPHIKKDIFGLERVVYSYKNNGL